MKDGQLSPFFLSIRVPISTLLRRYSQLELSNNVWRNFYCVQTGWNPLTRASTEGNLKLLKIIVDRGGRLNDVILKVPDTTRDHACTIAKK